MKPSMLALLTCALVFSCTKDKAAEGGAAPTAAAAAPSGVSAKDLHGSWKVNVDEVKKQAEALEKAGKKDEAMGIAMVGATQMTVKFSADGKAEMKMINPFSDKAETKVEQNTYVVASAKGDTLNVKVTGAKGEEAMELTIKGNQLTMKDDKGTAIPFVRE